jgi:hypothetical protein
MNNNNNNNNSNNTYKQSSQNDYDYIPYPDRNDDDFHIDIYNKKEFRDTETYENLNDMTIGHYCGNNNFILQKPQEFVRTFMASATPYNGMLLYWGTGSGKCIYKTSKLTLTHDKLIELPIELTIECLWNTFNKHNKSILDNNCDAAEWLNISNNNIHIDSYCYKTNSLIKSKIMSLYRQRIHEPIRKVTLQSGKSIGITLTHKLYSNDKWSNHININDNIKVHTDAYNKTPFNCINDKVTQIEILYCDDYVYDLEIENTHNYVANGIICHNTCGGIQMSESLMSSVDTDIKKCYIIATPQTQNQFRNTLYNPYIEKEEALYRGSKSCIENKYYPEISDILNKVETIDKRKLTLSELKSTEEIINRIKTHYTTGYPPLKYDDLSYIISKLPLNQRIKYTKYNIHGMIEFGTKFNRYDDNQIKEMFNDSVIIVDEIHKLTRSESTSKDHEANINTMNMLKKICKMANNIKLILMTATPMKDISTQILDIINLLLINEGLNELELKDIFNVHGDLINIDKLKTNVRGFVSYVRGGNTKAFPTKYDRPINLDGSHIYINETPQFKQFLFHIEQKESTHTTKSSSTINSLTPSRIKYTKLIKCPMSDFQFSVYAQSADAIINRKERSSDVLRSSEMLLIQQSFMVFPGKNNDNKTIGIPKNYFLSFNYNHQRDMGNYTSPIKKDNIQTKDFVNDCLCHRNIGIYSSKLYRLIHDIINSHGISLVYTEQINAQLDVIALMLMRNGYEFVLYKKNSEIIKKCNGMVDENEKRCYCGQVKFHPIHNTTVGGHEFTQGRFTIITGNTSQDHNTSITDITKKITNTNGKDLSIILITDAGITGIDYGNLRNVMAVVPWHNMTRMDQLYGRAARLCSHKNQPPKNMNYTIYRYCASIPDDKINKEYYNHTIKQHGNNIFDEYYKVPANVFETETVDEKRYRKAETKDIYVKKVQRALMESAVDCRFNKLLNKPNNLVDYSRDCEYQLCEYECDGFKQKNKIANTPYEHTYNNVHLYSLIRKIKPIIVELYKYDYVYDYTYINKHVTQKMNARKIYDKYISKALIITLENLIVNGIMILDKYNRPGTIISKSNNNNLYYIFKPNEIKNPNIPLRYLSTPLTVKYNNKNLFQLKRQLEMDTEAIKKAETKKKISYRQPTSFSLDRLTDEPKLNQYLYNTINGPSSFNRIKKAVDSIFDHNRSNVSNNNMVVIDDDFDDDFDDDGYNEFSVDVYELLEFRKNLVGEGDKVTIPFSDKDKQKSNFDQLFESLFENLYAFLYNPQNNNHEHREKMEYLYNVLYMILFRSSKLYINKNIYTNNKFYDIKNSIINQFIPLKHILAHKITSKERFYYPVENTWKDLDMNINEPILLPIISDIKKIMVPITYHSKYPYDKDTTLFGNAYILSDIVKGKIATKIVNYNDAKGTKKTKIGFKGRNCDSMHKDILVDHIILQFIKYGKSQSQSHLNENALKDLIQKKHSINMESPSLATNIDLCRAIKTLLQYIDLYAMILGNKHIIYRNVYDK